MKKMHRVATWLGVAVLSFSVGFISDLSDDYFEISKNLDIFGNLYREVNTLYVEDTDPNKLMRTGIDAMLGSLDPYTNFISEEEVEDFRFISTGAYAGVGALIGKRDDHIVVLESYEGYPADQAGLKAGDELVSIGATQIDGTKMGTVDVRNLLRGERGSLISVRIQRPGASTPIDLEIKRDRIKIDNVPYYGMVNERIGYIALTGFTEDAGKEVEKATRLLRQSHPLLEGLVLDLRGNPGGRLDEAVNVTNVFIPKGELVVETRGRIKGSKQRHVARRLGIETELPLAVLIDGRSASASEIVAGAIQDLDRGVVIGSRSFGKGLVQNIRPLIYNTQLKITTAKYYTPSGRCIQAIDYAERDADGQAARIPDSLRSIFYTRSGRAVRDGGGIGPDVEVSHEDLPRITASLEREGVIFAFANQYVVETPSLEDPRTFQVSEDLYKQFVAFAKTQSYEYQTPADKELDKLRRVVADESYAELLSDELDALTTKLADQKVKDLTRYQQAISLLLEREIVARYHYEAGAIEASLDNDPDVDAAVAVLQDDKRYTSILKGEEK